MKIFTHIRNISQSHRIHYYLTIGEINTGNARFHAQFQLDLHSFDQNILSFENSFFLTIRKDLIRSWIFCYISFTFYIQFILFAGK